MPDSRIQTLPDAAPRDWWLAAKRGFWSRCPHCNEGRLFRAYLKPVDACANCGEEFHHHRADDAPPYLTILFVGHLVGALMLFAHERDLNMSMWTEAIVWPLVGGAMCLWFLPRFKGALIAYQWALRMHGFATAAPTRPGKADSLAQMTTTTA